MCQRASGLPVSLATTAPTQGGWGNAPNGNNPGSILANNVVTVYPSGVVDAGIPGDSGHSIKFQSDLVNEGTPKNPNWVTEAAPYFIQMYLPAGGAASSLIFMLDAILYFCTQNVLS